MIMHCIRTDVVTVEYRDILLALCVCACVRNELQQTYHIGAVPNSQ